MTNTDFFAQDAAATAVVVDLLITNFKKHPDLHWAALVDGAFDFPRSDTAPYASHGINCYLFDACEGLQEAAPWLMPLASEKPDPQRLEALLLHCAERPMLSFVASRLPTSTLKAAWENLHWISATDEQRMILRMADTRILPNLPHILTPEQWAAFTAPLEHWLFIDRQGQLTPCPLAATGCHASEKIELTQAQLDLLLQAAEPDAVIDLLAENMSDVIPPDIKNSALYSLISATCLLAKKHKVDTFTDIVSLSVAACLTAGASNNNPVLPAILEGKKWADGKLGDALLDAEII